MAKRVALNKRDRDKMKTWLLARRAELLADLDGTETEIDQLQDPKADDLDRAVEAGTMELLVALGDTERRELEEIMLAMEKLESNSYGKCEACLETPLKLCESCPFIPNRDWRPFPPLGCVWPVRRRKKRTRFPTTPACARAA